jgi:hypothetical protein
MQVLGPRAVNEVKVGHTIFHWNQYSHVDNPNSLPGQTHGIGAPQISFRGLTLGQTHAITPQNIADEEWSLRDDFTLSFQKRGRHDLRVGGEYLHDFTFETVCQNCMGILDVQGGPIPANIESLFPSMTDVSTWNLAPLSPIARTYQRNIATPASKVSRPAGSGGFTEYAPRHVMAAWAQDDWMVSDRLTLNLGLRYDAGVGAFVNWVEFPPFVKGDRPNDLDNIAPRVGFAYRVTDATVLRGGFGKYFAEITSQPAAFTLRFTQQVSPLIQNDGRPDFASNPFNGPAPSHEQALLLQCSNSPDPLARTCLRPSLQNFVADDLEVPYSYQSSIGVQRQIGREMAVEADYVFTGVRAEFNTRNINIAYNPATGGNYPLIGANVDFSKRPFPAWGSTQLNRSDRRTNYHALQTSLNKRMSNRWQASATYTFSGQREFDQLPLNPGCKYLVTISAAGAAVCDVPITLAKDISENDWYLTGDQRNRATLNGIWDVGHGFQLSGLYIFGDNGKATPQAGVDTRQVGSSTGRLRANGTIIERNSLDIPSFHRMDMRIQQRVPVGRRVRIDGIFEVYNVFNHSNYENSNTGFVINESNARFGKPNSNTNLAFAPRMLQLGFRAQF